MEPLRLLVIAVAAEAVVGTIGATWIVLRRVPWDMGRALPSVFAGIVAAGVLALVNYWLLRRAPDSAIVRSLRAVYRDMLEPLFVRIGMREIVLISLAAGIGEELLFRGAIQAEWGLLPASLLFGAAHLGGSGTMGFGVWAALIGTFLGGLAMLTGGLLAPIIAHAAYDALALAYIRKHAPRYERDI
jgi:membrane protease YdiL (CAAX protease family)